MSFYGFARFVITVGSALCLRVRYEGRENIPASGGFIMAANHVSLLDPLLVARGLRPQLHFMAKAELFRNPLLGWMIKTLGSFPVERGKGDSGAIDRSVAVIQAGGALGIFPEGTRSRDGVPLRPKSGVALIAKMTGADILPCGITLEGKMRFGARVTIRFGKVIQNHELGFTDESPSAIKRATKRIWEDILALCNQQEVTVED